MATDGSVVITEVTYSSMKLVTFAWTSGADGGVNGFSTTKADYSGEVSLVVTVPGTSGSQPTSYTVSVIDSNGIDLLCGGGTTRSTTLTEYLKRPLGAVGSSALSLVVTGAGAAKSGTVYVFLR